MLRAVDDVGDLCSSSGDPCIIRDHVSVVDGTHLDFGSRAVMLDVDGQIDIGRGRVTLSCGHFYTTGGNTPAFTGRGSWAGGPMEGGDLTLEASAVTLARAIRAQGLPAGSITIDAQGDVLVGALIDVHSTGGDGDGGTILIKSHSGSVTLAGALDAHGGHASGGGSIAITAAFDVLVEEALDATGGGYDGGEITVYAGRDVSIGADLRVSSIAHDGSGGDVMVSAAGEISFAGAIEVSSDGSSGAGAYAGDGGDQTYVAQQGISIDRGVVLRSRGARPDGDGGSIVLSADQGILVEGRIKAKGAGAGGDVEVESLAGGATLAGEVDVSGGGDSSGGSVTITVAGDVLVNDRIDASGGGDGGEVSAISSVGNVMLESLVDASGGRTARGGIVEIASNGDILVANPIDVTGGEFDGGEISIDAGSDVWLSSDLVASATSRSGSGGEITVGAANNVHLTGPLVAAADGSNWPGNFAGDGGSQSYAAGSDISIDDAVVIRTEGGSPDGRGGSVDTYAAGDVFLRGRLEANTPGIAGVGGNNTVEGCNVAVGPGGVMEALGSLGVNTLSVRRQLTISADSEVLAGPEHGINEFAYSDPAEPPVVAGVVLPAPRLVLDYRLPVCPRCGNGVIEDDETCDDGNAVGSDGCNDRCQDEGCVADTPGYPGVALCVDGLACTVDTCDVVHHRCLNIVDCDDGIDCTRDICVNGVCTGVADCPDGAVCSAASGECMDIASTTTVPIARCGNSIVDEDEECDDGDTVWQAGQACRGDCSLVACGDPDDSGTLSATDALLILLAAVGGAQCDPCIADIDGSLGPPTASDALRVLRCAVGEAIELGCPPCE